MNVELIKDENNKVIGWEMTASTEEEIAVVNSIRNMQFFGYDDTAIRYAGRKNGSKDYSDAGTLMWKQSKYIKH